MSAVCPSTSAGTSLPSLLRLRILAGWPQLASPPAKQQRGQISSPEAGTAPGQAEAGGLCPAVLEHTCTARNSSVRALPVSASAFKDTTLDEHPAAALGDRKKQQAVTGSYKNQSSDVYPRRGATWGPGLCPSLCMYPMSEGGVSIPAVTQPSSLPDLRLAATALPQCLPEAGTTTIHSTGNGKGRK